MFCVIVFICLAVLDHSKASFANLSLASEEAENDKVFAEFLNQKMGEYSSWVTQNQYDPSPSLTKHVRVSSTFASKVTLSCNITCQIMRDHSERTAETVETISGFEGHWFFIMRNLSNVFEINGDLTCSGKVNAEWYSEYGLEEDIPFNGRGALTFWVYSSIEVFQVNNVGITEDHKLNLDQSDYSYALNATSTIANFWVTWNDSKLQDRPYAADIENEIKEVYKGFLRFDQPKNQLSPPFELLRAYVLEFAEDLDLKDVLVGVNLPDPYIPPTATTTSSTPTTTLTSRATMLSIVTLPFQIMFYFALKYNLDKISNDLS